MSDSVRKAIHFFVNFDNFKWLYLAYVWVNLHQTWRFCKAWSALYDSVCGSIVANPVIYRLVPSPSRFETRQWFLHSGLELGMLLEEATTFIIIDKAIHNTINIILNKGTKAGLK